MPFVTNTATTYENVLNELLLHKKEIFIEMYLKKQGEYFRLISIPENYDDCYQCLLYKHFTLTEVKLRKFDNILVQFNLPASINSLKALSKKFKFQIFDDVRLDKLEFTGKVCDSIYCHNPVSTIGQAFQATYRRYFGDAEL